MNIRELREAVQAIEDELREINDAAGNRALDDEQQERWDELTVAYDRAKARLNIAEAARLPGNVISGDGADFSHERPARRAAAHLSDELQAVRSGGLRGIEHLADADVLDNRNAKRLESWLDQSVEDPLRGADARRFALTSSPQYERAFWTLVTHPQDAHVRMRPEELQVLQEANSPELRAALDSTSAAYAVPPSIDPTVILTAAGSWNPFRRVSRVVTVSAGHSTLWEGITSAGITASYTAESTEVSDDTPTLTQPQVNIEKAQAFVRFTIEAGADWQNLQAEMATEFADAKDRLEENKFAVGAGHGSHEPEGIITGATVNYTTCATSVSPALSDFPAMQDALDPRYEHNAAFVMNKKLVSKIRDLAVAAGYQQDWANITSGGETGNDRLSPLFGDPIYRATSISGAYGTAGESIAVYGDWRNFVIVDRIGMSVELIPLLLGTNQRPTGERGLYAYWRSSSGAVNPDAFVVMKSS